MQDTVAIEHYLRYLPPIEWLRRQGWRPMYSSFDASIARYVLNGPLGCTDPRLTISLRRDEWFLKAEASLPRLLKGVNVPLLSDEEVQESLELMEMFVKRKTDLEFDIASCRVCRADFTFDYQVSDIQVLSAIAKLRRLNVAGYNSTAYADSGVVFTPKAKRPSNRFSAYPKLPEVLSRKGTENERDAAKGVLRFEMMMRTPALNAIVKKLDLPDGSVRSILTRKVTDHVFQKAAGTFQLDAILAADEEDDINKLVTTFGVRRAQTLLGCLAFVRNLGPDFRKCEPFTRSGRSIARDIAACRRAGIIP